MGNHDMGFSFTGTGYRVRAVPKDEPGERLDERRVGDGGR
jgi:hypothetical protein